MQKAKRYLCLAGIFEIVLASIYLIVDGIYTYSWLSELNIEKQSINIVISCLLFVLSIVIVVDGILALRYARAADQTAKKCKLARLLMGIVYFIVAILSFVLACVVANKSYNDLVIFGFIVNFIALIIIGLFNVFTFTNMGKEEPIVIEVKPSIEIKPNSDKVKPSVDIEKMYDKLNRVLELKQLGLISDQEFEVMRNKIISENHLDK